MEIRLFNLHIMRNVQYTDLRHRILDVTLPYPPLLWWFQSEALLQICRPGK